MKIKRLIELLEEYDKNLDILVGDEWIETIELVQPIEKYAVPYVRIIKEED
jgi:hypothetical protein